MGTGDDPINAERLSSVRRATRPRKVRPFTVAEQAEFLAFADSILALPPKRPHTERYPGKGKRVLRFVLPLGMAQPLNRSRHAEGWKSHREREAVLTELQWQLARQARLMAWPEPMPGRPLLRAIRFTLVEPDPTAAWFKVATDVLLPPKRRRGKLVRGLNVLRDDRPSVLELRHWTEPAPPNGGGALIEIWTGEK
jgi:hypothetical protein